MAQPFTFAWHVVVASDGTVTSTFDNIDENAYGIKAKSTVLKGTDVTVVVDDVVNINGQDTPIGGELGGVLSADGNEVNGTWTQTEPQQPPVQVHFKRGAATPAAPAAASQAAASQAGIAGDWAGTLKAGSAELRLVLHITAAKDGSFTATLDSIDQGANGIPINTATSERRQAEPGCPGRSWDIRWHRQQGRVRDRRHLVSGPANGAELQTRPASGRGTCSQAGSAF